MLATEGLKVGSYNNFERLNQRFVIVNGRGIGIAQINVFSLLNSEGTVISHGSWLDAAVGWSLVLIGIKAVTVDGTIKGRGLGLDPRLIRNFVRGNHANGTVHIVITVSGSLFAVNGNDLGPVSHLLRVIRLGKVTRFNRL